MVTRDIVVHTGLVHVCIDMSTHFGNKNCTTRFGFRSL